MKMKIGCTCLALLLGLFVACFCMEIYVDNQEIPYRRADACDRQYFAKVESEIRQKQDWPVYDKPEKLPGVMWEKKFKNEHYFLISNQSDLIVFRSSDKTLNSYADVLRKMDTSEHNTYKYDPTNGLISEGMNFQIIPKNAKSKKD